VPIGEHDSILPGQGQAPAGESGGKQDVAKLVSVLTIS